LGVLFLALVAVRRRAARAITCSKR
jgi:hypothetical protein